VRKLVPPKFAVPFLPPEDAINIGFVSIEKSRPIETKYVEKGIIVKDIDRCTVSDQLRNFGIGAYDSLHPHL
jgi:hypothetical protein